MKSTALKPGKRNMLRQTPLKRTPMKRSTKPINRVSKKRAAQMEVYAELRDEILEERPICQRCCMAQSVDVHHLLRRSASTVAVILKENCVALCRIDHDWIHANPAKARETGWLIGRFNGNR